MSGFQSHSMNHSEFLRIASNILIKCLLNADRINAKAMFNNLLDGEIERLVTAQMEDGSELSFDITLEHTEYRGKLNHSAFKTNLSLLLMAVDEFLKAEKNIPVLTDEQTGTFVFGLPGLAEDKNSGELNALLLGADLGQPGTACLKLQFFEPDQFINAETASEA